MLLRGGCSVGHAPSLCGILGGRGRVAGPGGAGGNLNLKPESTAGSVSGVRVRVRKSKLCSRQDSEEVLRYPIVPGGAQKYLEIPRHTKRYMKVSIGTKMVLPIGILVTL